MRPRMRRTLSIRRPLAIDDPSDAPAIPVDDDPANPYGDVGPADAPVISDDDDPATPHDAVGPADTPVVPNDVDPATSDAVALASSGGGHPVNPGADAPTYENSDPVIPGADATMTPGTDDYRLIVTYQF